jgi:hypothetical protein
MSWSSDATTTRRGSNVSCLELAFATVCRAPRRSNVSAVPENEATFSADTKPIVAVRVLASRVSRNEIEAPPLSRMHSSLYASLLPRSIR